ncbi:MAG: restriction endonuclease subunit S [Methylotenera sp.]|nr:restriction endonuclease subunit S [Methylotenera sp.]MDD4926145.1 restriction endonuclease subunit S [Methylotenera sp.]
MWIELPLSSLADIISGGTPSRDNLEFWGGNIPWVTPTDITACHTNYLYKTSDKITKKGLLNSSAKLLPAGSILLTSRATVGISRIAGIPVCTNQGFKNLTPLQNTNGMFLFYQVQRLRGSFERYAAGSTFPEINKKDTARVLIPHPIDTNVQQKIASILTSIDTAIEKTEALIEKYQQIKAGLMHDLFTRGVLPSGQLRPPREQAPELYQETSIGWIPKEWSLKNLKDLYKNPIRDFGSFSSTNLITFLQEGIPFIKSEMIKEGEMDWESTEYISPRVHILLSKSHVAIGNILFSKIGSALGKAVLYDGARGVCNSNAAVAKIEVNQNLALPQFIEAYLNSDFSREQFRSIIVSLLPRINLGDIDKLKIRTPPVTEQKIICDHLSAITNNIKISKNEVNKLQNQKLGLMQDLLTGKVEVSVSDGKNG